MKNNVFQLSHEIKKTLIEASCIYNMHTEEKIFAAATFEDLWVVSSPTE